MIRSADCVIGLSYGDEGKGKITAKLASTDDYDIVARWAGGNNAGHTVYVNGNKYKTHLIPSGIFYKKLSVIGPGCVLHPKSFHEEVSYLKSHGFDVSLIKVHPKCHIVTDEHIEYDKAHLAKSLGTTSKGIAPCYSDKALRKGIQAKDVLDEKWILTDRLSGNLLCEGAQGVWLDIDHGNQPYVTSSHTLPYAACSLGFAPQLIKNIYGAAKIYDTRSGVDPDFPDDLLDDEVLARIGQLGSEFGVTTGRRRTVKWLDLSKLVSAINISGTTHLVISKCDIFDKLLQDHKDYKVQLNYEGFTIKTRSMHEFKKIISDAVNAECSLIEDIKFSYSPEDI